jgi:hypothetical protein
LSALSASLFFVRHLLNFHKAGFVALFPAPLEMLHQSSASRADPTHHKKVGDWRGRERKAGRGGFSPPARSLPKHEQRPPRSQETNKTERIGPKIGAAGLEKNPIFSAKAFIAFRRVMWRVRRRGESLLPPLSWAPFGGLGRGEGRGNAALRPRSLGSSACSALSRRVPHHRQRPCLSARALRRAGTGNAGTYSNVCMSNKHVYVLFYYILNHKD